MNYLLPQADLKDFLEEKYKLYASPAFIENDPIQIPRRYQRPEDIEIAAFMAASLAWGQRSMIIRYVGSLLESMGESPYDFVCHFKQKHHKIFEHYKYRTFCQTDCISFLNALKNIYLNHGGLQKVFNDGFQQHQTILGTLAFFRNVFVSDGFAYRSVKHVSNVCKGSAAKRLNMFIRWMVRPNKEGVDFGLWPTILPSALMLPLDVHTARVSRLLGLLKRKQNDWKAVEEVTANLRTFDPFDPVKYDFALFGVGVFEKFGKDE
jgi:uncharacterized protein (TIGR02757 family)